MQSSLLCVSSNVTRCLVVFFYILFGFVAFSALGKSVQNPINLPLPEIRHMMRVKHERGLEIKVALSSVEYRMFE